MFKATTVRPHISTPCVHTYATQNHNLKAIHNTSRQIYVFEALDTGHDTCPFHFILSDDPHKTTILHKILCLNSAPEIIVQKTILSMEPKEFLKRLPGPPQLSLCGFNFQVGELANTQEQIHKSICHFL